MKNNIQTDCEKQLHKKYPEITPTCRDQMDYYLTGDECGNDEDCKKAVQEYVDCKNSIVDFDTTYLNVVRDLIKNGTWKLNERTGKRCLFMHGGMMKFDLSTGHFPLLTTKKMAVKSMIGELIGFLRGVDNAKDFRDLKCKFWDENANSSEHWLNNPNRKGTDDLGRIYGVQARNRQSFFEVTPNIFEVPKTQIFQVPIFELDEKITIEKSKHDGEKYTTDKYGEFEVIGANRDGKFIKYIIRFLNTGYIKYNIPSKFLKNGAQVKDIYSPTVAGIACMGDLSDLDSKIVELLKGTWRDMIYRCYSENRRMNHPWYMDSNIFVDTHWLIFENFVKDFKKLDRWELKMEYPDEYSIDKDFYCSNKYSSQTCVWASKQEQNINTRQGKQFTAMSPDGVVYHECGLGNFAKKHNLNRRSVEMALTSGVKNKGWLFKKLDSNKMYRIRIDDQLAHCVAKIKHNPTDRRMVVDHWNPNELHMMALPPCHLNYTFGIRDGFLDMCMYQRSCDIPLGIPMNIASYALLLELISKITGLKAGVFTHFMWNYHIYEDQLEKMKEQLSNKPYNAPILKIDCELNSLDDITNKLNVDDISFENYQHHEAIKFPFAK